MALAPLKEPIDLLMVDDEPDFLEPACRFFQRQGYRVTAAASGEQAIAVQSQQHFSIAVLDQNMPGICGLDLVNRLLAEDPELKILMLTGNGNVSDAVEAMKRGVVDYIQKPFGLDELDVLLRRLVHAIALEKENQHLRRMVQTSMASKPIIGQSSVMEDVRRLIARVAKSDKPVLILGESGTGKELVARAVHAASPLANKPLVVINCAALPESLLESELFGHEKGAFTGANDAKPGLFEVADGGTLFIDEFGELAPSLQAKLLRVLEDGSMRRVGSTKERKVKVRLIAATNRDLTKLVSEGRFREDLYYRVNVLAIHVPPLRDRKEDIPQLIHHFLGPTWKLGPGVENALVEYAWPGNIRQLLNSLERGKILSDDHTITMENLPEELRHFSAPTHHGFGVEPSKQLGQPYHAGDAVTIDTLTKQHVLEVLKKNLGNKSRAAKELGIARRSLYRVLEQIEGNHH